MALLRGSPSKQLIFKCWYLLTRTASGPKARLRNSSYEYLWIIIWWASPTLKTGYSFTVIYPDLSFWRGWSKLHVEGGMGFTRNIQDFTLNIQVHLRRFGIYLDPKIIQVPNTEPQEGLHRLDVDRVFQSSRDLPGPTPGFEKDYYRSKETLPSHVQKLSCGGNSHPKIGTDRWFKRQEFWFRRLRFCWKIVVTTIETMVYCILIW